MIKNKNKLQIDDKYNELKNKKKKATNPLKKRIRKNRKELLELKLKYECFDCCNPPKLFLNE